MALPPLRSIPRLVEPIWGGTRLAAWLDLPEPWPTRLGESWLIYEHNVVQDGPYAGRSLAELAREYGAALVGTRTLERYGAEVPLLAKFIDAADRLSLQVHPDDAYAQQFEADTGFHGKTEAWYILDAVPGATVSYGLIHACTHDEFAAAVANGSVEGLMAHLPVAAGDIVFVPAGIVHAINAGIMLFEIQQKSDLTYRVYDYGRRDAKTGQPRALHVEQALAVSRLTPSPEAKIPPLKLSPGRELLIACSSFALERWKPEGALKLATEPGSFEIWTLIEGMAHLVWGGMSFSLKRGDTLLLPANLGHYMLVPQSAAMLLRTYVPDLASLGVMAEEAGMRAEYVARVVVIG